MHCRKAKYAGILYPAEADALSAQIARKMLLVRAEHQVTRMILVPQGEQVFSGSAAATAYRSLQFNCQLIKRVIIVSNNPVVPDRVCVLTSYHQFETPLGAVSIAHDAITKMAQFPSTIIADEYHTDSLTMELNLPFIQLCLINFELLPIVVGAHAGESLSRLLASEIMRQDTLIVFSFDWQSDGWETIDLALRGLPSSVRPSLKHDMFNVIADIVQQNGLKTTLTSDDAYEVNGIAAIFST